MCGIFAYLGKKYTLKDLEKYFMLIQYRGPDNTHEETLKDGSLFVFHRLMINGLDSLSDQPMRLQNCVLMCNGEIYNYKELIKENGFEYKTNSDCEIIIHLYRKYGIEKTCQLINGAFFFMLYDLENDTYFCARDHLGIRGGVMGYVLKDDFNSSGVLEKKEKEDEEKEISLENYEFCFASELKCLTFADKIHHFPPKCYWSSKDPSKFHDYFNFKPPMLSLDTSLEDIYHNIRIKFTKAVRERIQVSDRPVGFLLSGGLDSSLSAAIGIKYFDDPKQCHTFSYGMKGSLDLENALKVAEHIGSTHHHIEVSEEEHLSNIETAIYIGETYDITTVRAILGHWRVCKAVKDSGTGVCVLISSEISDEIFAGYLENHYIKEEDVLHENILFRLNEVGYFDNLRGDRSISSNSLEGRLPFSDREFLTYVLSIPPKFKMHKHSEGVMEKQILRDAFKGMNLLPDEVLYRRKDGFSDGVSSKSRSTVDIMKEHMNKVISDEEFKLKMESKVYDHCPPKTKEGLYYRELFDKFFGEKHAKVIPYYWMPRYGGDGIEPSGRVIESFDHE